MTTAYTDHRFSVTIHTDDLAVVNCLRALSKFSQRTGNGCAAWVASRLSWWYPATQWAALATERSIR